MSTFDGLVAEFPQIRIDFFRVNLHHPPPLACFLSHVHSDHLQGLESLRSPFVYCSPATREILLGLEKYPHRMNFAKGILESRKQTYKHLRYLLKTIPLETPTTIELSPNNEIQATLFDANHCIGAVMFLIQGQGKAILYTGDVRAEPWWVNSMVHNPVLLPYASGYKRLDTIYLDTTYANRSEVDRQFPSKAEGLHELLTKVSSYPQDTFFHFEAWTFGYKKVWTALSACLGSQIHLDKYRWRLYRSLIDLPQCSEAPPLVGFQLGNHRKHGCLTQTPDPRIRLDSCEQGTYCPMTESNPSVVKIIPIVKRLKDGTEIAEVGVGGGKGDLDQIHELETNDPMAIRQLMTLCASKLEDPETLSKVLRTLTAAMDNGQGRIRLRSSQYMEPDDYDAFEDMPLQQFVDILAHLAGASSSAAATQTRKTQHVSAHAAAVKTPTAAATADQGALPRVITFPWARHASYSELCDLVQAFRPRDVYPCTVDKVNWTPTVSMRALFGNFCSDDVFAHDSKMMAEWEERERGSRGKKRKQQETQDSQDSDGSRNEQHTDHETSSPVGHHDTSISREHIHATERLGSVAQDDILKTPTRMTEAQTTFTAAQEQIRVLNSIRSSQMRGSKDLLTVSEPALATPLTGASTAARTSQGAEDVEQGETSPSPPSIREWAGRAARNSQGMDWASFGGLVCTGNGHTEEEEL